MFGLSYTQPTTYASTNPFLTGAYLNYSSGEMSYGDKFNMIGSSVKDTKAFFESYSSSTSDNLKYLSKNYEPTINESVYTTSDTKFNATSWKYPEKNYLGMTSYSSELKYSPGKESVKSGYDTSPNVSQSPGSALLTIEDTPTPTSSIETEDSTTREVGEKDVEGDGEQSD